MDINIKYTGDVNALLTISVSKADYQENFEKAIKSFRNKASMPGFRAGMVPASLIRKRYGRDIKVEEINKLVAQSMYEYLDSNNIRVLGQPMWHEDQPEQDYDTAEDFTYLYDLAISPRIEFELSEKDKLPYYRIVATDEEVDAQVKQLLSRHGPQVEVDEVAENDLVRGLLTEMVDGQPKDGGVVRDNATLLPKYITDEEVRNKIVGAIKNTVLLFNPYKAYQGNAYEISSLLGIDRKQVEMYADAEFSFEIESISRHEDAEMNEDFFKEAFGEDDSVKDEASLRESLRSNFEKIAQSNSDFKLMLDLRDYMLDKVGTLTFPDVLLKRWLRERNPELSIEEIEQEYPRMIKELTYNMIRDQLSEKYELKISAEDLKAYAIAMTRSQFAQYGMGNMPDEVIEKYASEQLNKQEERERIAGQVMEGKIIEAVKPLITLDEKTVTNKEFQAFFNPEQDEQE